MVAGQPDVKRQPQRRPLKPGRGDADDGEDDGVDSEGAADGRRSAGEVRVPVVVRDDEHGPLARNADVGVLEQPARCRLEAERSEVAAGHEEPRGATDVRRLADRERRHPERLEPLERRQPRVKVAVVQPGRTEVDAVASPRLDRVERRGVRDRRQRLPADHLEPREHDRIGADADGERGGDDGGEDWRPAQGTPRLTKVTHQRPWM